MESSIEIRTQGIRGGNAKYERKGIATIYATDKGQFRSDLQIDADSFTGAGSTYKKRENTLISVISDGERIFEGTITDFVSILKIGI